MAEQMAIFDFLAKSEKEMIGLIEKLVNIDSGSYDKAGTDKVGEALAEFFGRHGIEVDRLPRKIHGDVFRARVPGPGNAPIVLMGHRDTVFPKGEPTRRPFKIIDGRAYGPGVSDMKAGLVMNAFVLAAFKKFGGNQAPLIGLYTSDEEIGSPECRGIIEETARGARAVFNSEPARASGNIVKGRKGGVFMQMDISGKAAHSGANFKAGRSAIGALAAKITEIHTLTDLKKGITLNVGLISGGQSVNTVAPSASAQIDMRYIQAADRARLIKKIQAIVRKKHVPGTSGEFMIRGEFLPVEEIPQNKRLFDTYIASAKSLGLKIAGEFTGGCADSGFTSAQGAPTVCGVGPQGGMAHSPEEFLIVDSIVPRAQVMASAILSAPGV